MLSLIVRIIGLYFFIFLFLAFFWGQSQFVFWILFFSILAIHVYVIRRVRQGRGR